MMEGITGIGRKSANGSSVPAPEGRVRRTHRDLKLVSQSARKSRLSFFRLFLCGARRGFRGRLLALLGEFGDGDDLDLQIGRRGRACLIDELLLAEAERLNAFRGNLEGVDQRVADRIRAALAQHRIS